MSSTSWDNLLLVIKKKKDMSEDQNLTMWCQFSSDSVICGTRVCIQNFFFSVIESHMQRTDVISDRRWKKCNSYSCKWTQSASFTLETGLLWIIVLDVKE